MALFKEDGDQIKVPAYLQHVQEFNDILEHKNSQKYLAYIYHLCDWTSPYAMFDEDERKEKLDKDILEGKKVPKILQEGIDKYRKLNTTDSLRLLESARKAVQKLRDYFDNADPAYDEDPGKSAKDLMMNLKNVGDIIKRLKEWEEEIKKEKETSTIRKGVKINQFNAD